MKNATINSSLALSSALLLTIILHELAHFLVALSFGSDATLFHNRVVNSIRFDQDYKEFVFLAAGPLLSLIQGVVFLKLSYKNKPSVIALFYSWIGITGLVTFFGYVAIGPIIPFGDTGRMFSMMSVPIWIQIIIALLSLLSVTLILIKTTKLFETFISGDLSNIKLTRKKWAISLVLIPLLACVIITSLLQFPITHFINILATASSPFAIFALFGSFIGSKNEIKSKGEITNISSSISYLLIILFISIVIVNRILVSGITF